MDCELPKGLVSVVNASTNPKIILDSNKNIIYANQEFLSTLEYCFNELKGKNVLDLFSSPEDKEEVSAKLKMKKSIPYNKKLKTKNSNVFIPFKIAGGDIDGKDFDCPGKLFRVVSFTNTSDLEEKEAEIKKQSVLIALNVKHAANSELLSNIAHHWRQPLSAISTISSGNQVKLACNEEIDKNEHINNYTLITELAQKLSSTIEDFRSFHSNDSILRYFSLEDVFLESLDLVKVGEDDFVLNKHVKGLTKIQQYKNELKTVFLAILKNSIEASKQDKTRKLVLDISISSEDEYQVLSLKDNAGGVAEKHLDKIFDAYFTTKHNYVDVGLGLYNSKILIEKTCGGKIEASNVENEDGTKGLEIKIYLKSL